MFLKNQHYFYSLFLFRPSQKILTLKKVLNWFRCGAAYSGLDVNFSFLSKTDMKYISVGCVEYNSRYGSTCRFGAGWVITDLFDFDSNNHGCGVYITKAGHESYVTFENGKHRSYEGEYYGAGVSYRYFMNGIDRSGFTFGGSIHATSAEYDETISGFIQVGYQL